MNSSDGLVVLRSRKLLATQRDSPSPTDLDLSGPQSTSQKTAVSRIEVRGLFGHLDYTLPAGSEAKDLSEVFILYGENGSGKTTILEMLFHLLSPATRAGHRTALTKIPFGRFEVTLADGSVISAFRPQPSTGDYEVQVRTRAELFTAKLIAEKRTFETDETVAQFQALLQRLTQSIYILPADRTLRSDALQDRDSSVAADSAVLREIGGSIVRVRQRKARSPNRIRSNRLVLQATRMLTEWIRKQAILANTRGTENANSIYADIVKRIAASPLDSSAIDSKPVQIASTLNELALRNAEYAKFGYISPLNIEEFLSVVPQLHGATAALVETILEPYINSTRARLDALQRIWKLTATFVENLNTFYTGKTVTFDLNEGVQIIRPDGTQLDPTLLSSGEQHMLLMFCHTLMARGGQNIFIIDEPELSLNIKWQRNLIQALRDLVQDAHVQFILASHSFEVLSEHMEHVVTLSPHTASFTPPVPGESLDSSIA